MSIAATERETYEAVWTGIAQYGDNSPGLEQVDRFLDMSGATGGSVLDAGCGSGKGALALQDKGFDVTLADLTASGLTEAAQALPFARVELWHDLSPVAYASTGMTKFAYVYCCDVLEHVPPEFTMLVIARLLAVTRTGLFLSISTVGDAYGAWVGKPLHQTVKDFVWWRDRLNELGQVEECRDLLNGGLYYVRPR